jgi:hypothetical protein
MQTPTKRRPSVPSAADVGEEPSKTGRGSSEEVRKIEEGQPIRVSGNPPQLPGPCTLTPADRRHWEGLKGPRWRWGGSGLRAQGCLSLELGSSLD